jgi:hypothetical protein
MGRSVMVSKKQRTEAKKKRTKEKRSKKKKSCVSESQEEVIGRRIEGKGKWKT